MFELSSKMKWLIFILILYVANGMEIKLVRFKSAREQMFEKGTTHEHLDFLKPKPKPGPLPNDTIALYKFLDSDIYGIVGIGHPAQSFKVQFDTAWANIYIPSKLCGLNVPACWLLNKYDSSRSGTYKRNGTKFVLNERDGAVEGFYSMDSFNVGHIKVKNQTFAEATKLPLRNILSVVDGVVGLGPDSLAIDGVTTLFTNIINQNLLQRPIFSIYLNRDTTTEHGGAILFGALDIKHYDPKTIFYVPVTSTYYWQFDLKRIVMDNSKESFPFCINGCQAVLDTSTRIIMGPSDDVVALNNYIGATKLFSNRYEIPCDLVNKMPKVNFTIQSTIFTLHGRDIVQEMSFRGFKVCLSVFVPSDLAPPQDNLWFLGSAFMQRAYVVFDIAKKNLGFAILP